MLENEKMRCYNHTKEILRRRTAWTVVIIEVEMHTVDTDLDIISGVCSCAY